MTTTDLDSIEHTLGFPLPRFYRHFMMSYPRWLLDKQPSGFEPVTQWEFADDPERVIEFNRFVRAQEDGWFFDDATWPDNLLVIGSEDDQNYFAVDRLGGDEGVLFWSHEDGSLTRITDSLTGYTDWLVRRWEDILRDREA